MLNLSIGNLSVASDLLLGALLLAFLAGRSMQASRSNCFMYLAIAAAYVGMGIVVLSLNPLARETLFLCHIISISTLVRLLVSICRGTKQTEKDDKE